MLYEVIRQEAFNYGLVMPNIPNYITNNIKYDLFKWQEDAIKNLIIYNEIRDLKEIIGPTHLLFNMATGSGKTLVMASCILYYYNKGYRKFIFLNTQNNIVDKTESNLIEKSHNKYLFKPNIVIDGKKVNIKKVENFTTDNEDIEIKFTTIQKIHNDIYLERENQLIYKDLLKYDIVLLADEAHHLNADTIRENNQMEIDFNEILDEKSSEEVVERKGWEHTIIELILNKNKSQSKNVLLEFTATVPENENVQKKYEDKILYKFTLKDLLSLGYTKEINLIASSLSKKDRILQALLFNWYRYKIALKYNIPNFKPVILFKSKIIDDSEKDYEEFLNITKNIKVEDFDFIKTIDSAMDNGNSIYEQAKSRTLDILNYIKKSNISFIEICDYIKNNFNQNTTIITNSKTKDKNQSSIDQKLNSLEDNDNIIRAVFTCYRLTEGWDVLNLYDIVRLYQGQNAGGSTKKTPKTTIQEKQLIGRGVRYYPFKYGDCIPNKRKFDNDLTNELRVLEELDFYTYDEESRYISELKNALKKDGYISDNKIEKRFDIKKEFRDTDIFKKLVLWRNKRINNPNYQRKDLYTIDKDIYGSYKIKSLEFREEQINFKDNGIDSTFMNINQGENKTIDIEIKKFESNIFYKAISILAKDSFFTFNSLSQMLDINSIIDLQNDEFLGKFIIKIIGTYNSFDDIPRKIKLDILISFLKKIQSELKQIYYPYVGSIKFEPVLMKDLFDKPKVKMIEKDNESDLIEAELLDKEWYILDSFYGTGEEKALIRTIKDTIMNLQEKYEKVYLLRNEEMYKIYDFDEGRGFEPDFILILFDKEEKSMCYQIFIEPKGSHLLDKDRWKNKFLSDINEKYQGKILCNVNDKYKIIGLPLYNNENNSTFMEVYNNIINKKKS